jgi:energy-coupling factor transport system substrate-specific component
MTNEVLSVKTVAAIGIGEILVFALMRFASIPSGVPNIYLNLGIAVLAIFAGIFGPLAGLLIGFIGHTMVDLTFGFGLWWSWVIADAFFGFLIGLFWKLYKFNAGGFGLKNYVIFNVVQILSNAAAWILVAPVLDILFYKGTPANAFYKGAIAAAMNSAVVLVLGTLLAFGYSKIRIKVENLKLD